MTDVSYRLVFNENDQELVFLGSMRPEQASNIRKDMTILFNIAQQMQGTLYLNFKKLRHINNTAFNELAWILSKVLESNLQLRIKVITSSVVPWASQKLQRLAELFANVIVEQYDGNFYPGQSVIEKERFIPVLRTQTKIIWPQERDYLPRHGLKPGMKIAEICCGIGDFAVLIYKEFKPKMIVAIDHSHPALKYARKIAKEFGIHGIKYHYGDAANLMLPDNEFDFVTCRLSLQIFHKPEQILKELYRICVPGGRIYLTNETCSKIFGYPKTSSIAWTYKELSGLFQNVGIDFEFGIKMYFYMMDCGLTDILIDPMTITTNKNNRDDFIAVVNNWKEYTIANDMVMANKDDNYRRELCEGFDDHICIINNPKGFSGWPIWVGSGSKPR
jgi:ubiquinone/menaquinone biosynthesis C-methylase UbiE